jgi:serine/threonine-protein kinase
MAADPVERQRFTREALAAARLSGEPGIVTIFDVGEWNDRPFLVMEYLKGGSLQDVLRDEGAQRPDRALDWLEQAARALDRAHERGIVHRDVKPANLLLDGADRVHVADFGVARATGLDTLTQTGTVIGTAGYLSPEQAQGREATPASDRYALGVVAFELLTGSRPFATGNAAAEAVAHVQAEVPSASARRPGLPPPVDAVLERALAKDPGARFESGAAFVTALRQAWDGTHTVAAVRHRRPRRLLGPLLLAALVLGGLAAALLLTSGHGRSTGQTTARITVTQQGTTVTTTAAATTTAPPTTAPPTTSAQSAAQLGYEKLQAGDAAGALPLLEQAARALQGSGGVAEAYNDYNLALALARTQGCSGRVLQLLDASQAIQGHRTEIDSLRKACRRHT